MRTRSPRASDYVAVIYFNGPATQWGNRIDEREIIARYASPFLWMVRIVVRAAHARLDPTRCGYVIVHEAKTIEHEPPQFQAASETAEKPASADSTEHAHS